MIPRYLDPAAPMQSGHDEETTQGEEFMPILIPRTIRAPSARAVGWLLA
jgi:hypothetical protein